MSSRADRVILEPNTQINEYKIITLLGQGGYGDVYKALNLADGKYYAFKTEYVSAPKKALEKEIRIISQLNSPYFPHIYASGTDGHIIYCVMDLFGKSISDYKKSLTFSKSIPSALLLTMGIEMIKAIKAFHEAGFIHRDIKPSNFLLSKNKQAPIALIDFGLARQFIDPETKKPIPPSSRPHFGGTKKYVSIRLHDRKDSSKCDDLASWFYTMVESWRGRLPWANIREKEEVGDRKRSISASELCYGMPAPFRDLYDYINSLEYYDVPDYSRIINTLQNMLATNYPNDKIDLHEFYYKVHRDEKKSDSEDSAQEDQNLDGSSQDVPIDQDEKHGCCILF